MRFLRYILLLFLVVGIGCTTPPETLALIEHSERVAIDYPDSALMLIESVDRANIRGKRDMAHYRLAKSEALYYNNIDSDCDSLTRPLFEYYYDSDLHAERARAMYQHGLVMMNAKKNAEAIHTLLEAEKSLQYYNDYRLLGLVYRTLGDIYYSQSIFGEAIASYIKAKGYFDKANLEYHSLYTSYELGRIYTDMRQFENAINTLLDAENFALQHNYNALRCQIITDLCFAYVQTDDYENCKKWFDELVISDTDYSQQYKYYCIKTIIEAYNGNYNEAYTSLYKAKSIDPNTNIYVMYAELQLFVRQGDTRRALEVYRELIKIQDKSVLELIKRSSSRDQLDYVEESVELLTELHHRSKIIAVLVVVVCVVLLLLIINIFVTKNRDKQERINTLSNQVESVKQELLSQNRRAKQLSNLATEKESAMLAMKRQLNENISLSLQNIDNILSAYYTDCTKRVKQNQIIEEIDRYVMEFASSKNGYLAVEEYVNQYRSNIMKVLREEMSTLTSNEYMLLCLIYADFSSNAICMFMGYDKNKLYKHKCRLKAKISSSDCISKEMFLRYL